MKTLTRTTVIFTLAATTVAVFGQAVPSARVANVRQTEVAPAVVLSSEPTRSMNSIKAVGALHLRRSVAGSVLVIPSTEMKPEDISAITEDMSIMARILDDRLEQEHLAPTGSAYALRRDTDILSQFLSPDGGATDSIYLEGFGPLFVINIDFPLSPSAEAEAQEPEQERTDQLWKDTWVEIYHPEEAAARKNTQPERQYDAAKVEDLQRTLIKTLKHAANIRILKSDESVTLVVRTSTPGMTFAALTLKRGKIDGKLTLPFAVPGASVPVKPTAAQAGFLTIRAKKSDINSFAKDQLNYDRFRQRVQIIKY
jgi:hypothetical protein